ncbi:MAG: DUF5788 family protein [Haloarculaceae archaeon]
MDDDERERRLERADAGEIETEDVPRQITVGSKPFDLREFVAELEARETVPHEERKHLKELRAELEGERHKQRRRIETEDMSPAVADRVADVVAGINRAIDEVESVSPENRKKQVDESRIEDHKRWLAFLDQIR